MEDLELPLDIKVEAFLGMILGILSAIFKYTSNLGKIKLQEVLAEQNKTYEFAANMNRSYSLRNIQRTRGGVVFAKHFPDAHKILNSNKQLSSCVSR